MQFEKIIERPRGFASFEDACAHLAELEKVAAERPDLIEKSNDGGRVVPEPVRRVYTIPPDVVRFEEAITNIMARDQCDRLAALTRMPTEHPDLLQSYQAAAG